MFTYCSPHYSLWGVSSRNFNRSPPERGRQTRDGGENKPFLADRTNGRAYATVLRLSVRPSVVCDVMYSG